MTRDADALSLAALTSQFCPGDKAVQGCNASRGAGKTAPSSDRGALAGRVVYHLFDEIVCWPCWAEADPRF